MNIEINGINLNYTKTGVGQPLILLHGNGEDHRIFDKLVDKLQSDFTIYAIDSRNHGESSKTDDYSYYTLADDLYQFVSKLDLQNVSIVGFSDGAIVALLTELRHEGLFSKLVLMGINLKLPDFKPEIYEYMFEEYRKTADPFIKMMLDQPDIELDALRQINAPTLLIAAQDELYRDELYEDMMQVLPDAQFKIMQGHDHGSYVVDQDILYADLVGFLK